MVRSNLRDVHKRSGGVGACQAEGCDLVEVVERVFGTVQGTIEGMVRATVTSPSTTICLGNVEDCRGRRKTARTPAQPTRSHTVSLEARQTLRWRRPLTLHETLTLLADNASASRLQDA